MMILIEEVGKMRACETASQLVLGAGLLRREPGGEIKLTRNFTLVRRREREGSGGEDGEREDRGWDDGMP